LGYADADDFEFVRLQNIGATSVDLYGVRFMLGITFDFSLSPVRYLTPGGNILAVANLGAFQARYGHGCDSIIAGVYAGHFSNSGEQVQLVDASGTIVKDFIYDDYFPWPEAADGGGPSLVLALPDSNPDHGNAANWTVSALPGGSPSGTALAQTYATWRALTWDTVNATNDLVSGQRADPDGDGLCNFLEYAFGSDPTRPSAKPCAETFTDDLEDGPHLALTIRLAAGARDVILTWEQSDDLVHWSSAVPMLESIPAEVSESGFCTQRWRETEPMALHTTTFFRLKVAGP
jgi:hypothetical protein